MGRVARYKKVKKGVSRRRRRSSTFEFQFYHLYRSFSNINTRTQDRAPSRKKLKKESYSNKVFREMMQMASKKKRIRRRNVERC